MAGIATGSGLTGGRRIRLRYAGRCRACGIELAAKSHAIYESATRSVTCLSCIETTSVEFESGGSEIRSPDTSAPIPHPRSGDVDEAAMPAEPSSEELGDMSAENAAGASARKEYERRRAKDEKRIRDEWGRFGGIAVALTQERQSTVAWREGAIGEEKLASSLAELDDYGCLVMHDRKIPRSRANIDHIVVSPAGVWVIDAKRYKGRPKLRVEGGLFRDRTEHLMIGHRDQTKLVDGVEKQMSVVQQMIPEVPVFGALCFVDADWPLFGGAFEVRGVRVRSPKKLRVDIREAPSVDIEVEATFRLLATLLRPA